MTGLSYTLREAFTNITRNGLVVLGAVLAVFVSLTLTFGTLVLGEVVRINTLQWAEDVRVSAYIRDDVSPSGIADLQTEMESWPEVDEVFFMSKTESLKEARVLLANRPAALRVIEDDPSIVPASLRIKPVDPDDYQTIVTRAEAMPGLLSVESAAEAIDGMISLRDGLQIMSLFLAVALGIAAVALIANTIHMAIYSRREEIEIMNLVGASNWFVRTPFLLEGAFEGFVGAGLAVLVVVGGLRIASNQLTELPDWINIGIQSDYLARNGALVLIFGVVAGLAGSGLSLAVHKYLRT
ncbi:MAG: permease-like cell division protein FtsX [Actinobacteria bacterium]|jgi:cell division transport system permease protein|nr:permease-like cell division protein FtsX [Actinomycetota bacterium]